MIYCIFDLESDGLRETATKIHCLSYQIIQGEGVLAAGTITDYEGMRKFIQSQTVLVGHNIITFDIPVLEHFLDIKIQALLIDTLGLSWYLYSTESIGGKIVKRERHGLEAWGEELGVEKPIIKDWENLSIEEYVFRCETDVRINTLLFHKEMFYLKAIYNNDTEKVMRLINYISFKMDCLREQEENPCHIDREALNRYLEEVNQAIDEKTEELSNYMPLVKVYREIKKPSPDRFYRKDGTLSISGEKWLSIQKENGLSDEETSFSLLVGTEPGNPKSSDQLKDWLLGLGWIPTYYKDSKSKKTGVVKKVAQVLLEDKTICPNIKKLYPEHPYLENLESLSLYSHRCGILQSFIDFLSSENTVKATAGGFTSTLRLQHRKPIVNLPKVDVFYGKEIRGLIIAPDENHFLCGSDMTALEATTQDHYMHFFDSEYVTNRRTPGFDPHLSLGVLSGIITKDEELFYKWYKSK